MGRHTATHLTTVLPGVRPPRRGPVASARRAGAAFELGTVFRGARPRLTATPGVSRPTAAPTGHGSAAHTARPPPSGGRASHPGCSAPKASGAGRCLASPIAQRLPCPSAPGPRHACLKPLILPPHLRVCRQASPAPPELCITSGLPGWSSPSRSRGQRRGHLRRVCLPCEVACSRVPGVRTQMCFGGGGREHYSACRLTSAGLSVTVHKTGQYFCLQC